MYLGFCKHWTPALPNKTFLCNIKIEHIQCVINSFFPSNLERHFIKKISFSGQAKFAGIMLQESKNPNSHHRTIFIHLARWKLMEVKALSLWRSPASNVVSSSDRRSKTWIQIVKRHISSNCIRIEHAFCTRKSEVKLTFIWQDNNK